MVLIWSEKSQVWRPLAGGPIPYGRALGAAHDYLDHMPKGRACVLQIKGGPDSVKSSVSEILKGSNHPDVDTGTVTDVDTGTVT